MKFLNTIVVCDAIWLTIVLSGLLLLNRPKMVWTIDHDVLLIREILVLRPFAFKFGSREREQAWDKIAETLNTVQ